MVNFPSVGNLSAAQRRIEIIERRSQIIQSFIAIGYRLREAHAQGDWAELRYPSWAAYCGDVLKESKTYAYDLMRLADLCDKYPQYREQIENAKLSNLRLLLPHIDGDTQVEQVEQLLNEARGQTWRELNANLNGESEPLQEMKQLVTCPNCRHQFEV